MNDHQFWRLTLLWLAGLVAGCGNKSPQPSPPDSPALANPLVAKCEPGQKGGRLTLLSPGLPRTFNPLLAMDGAADQAAHLLFASLVTLDATTQSAGPGLAESWSVEPDGKTWTFKLRAGLRWSDGEPLTAEDVVFTWTKLMYDPDLNRQTYDLFRVNGKNFEVTRLDDVTVRVVTPEIFAPFLEYFGGVNILPKHTLDAAVTERRFLSAYAINTRADRIVGSGPFRVKEVQPEKGILLERNPHYWVVDSANQPLPYFDEVFLLAVNGASPTQYFLSGQGDVCESVRVWESDAVRAAAASAGIRLLELGYGTERDFLWFNQNTNRNAQGSPLVSPIKLKWFREKEFRQAMSCAIDRDRLVKEAYDGRAQPMLTYLGSDNPKWNNPGVPSFGFDQERARRLLASIGLMDRNGDGVLEDAEGHVVEFTLLSNTGNPGREKCANLIAEDFQRLGCRVKYVPLEFMALVERVNAACDYDCVLMGLGGGGVDPASQINVLRSSEMLHQWFPNQPQPATAWEARIDALMDAQLHTLNLAERKKHFDEVQQILAEQMPMIYTVAPFQIAAARPDIANLNPARFSTYRLTWNVEQLYRRKP